VNGLHAGIQWRPYETNSESVQVFYFIKLTHISYNFIRYREIIPLREKMGTSIDYTNQSELRAKEICFKAANSRLHVKF
jgi:hypothetical protein